MSKEQASLFFDRTVVPAFLKIANELKELPVRTFAHKYFYSTALLINDKESSFNFRIEIDNKSGTIETSFNYRDDIITNRYRCDNNCYDNGITCRWETINLNEYETLTEERIIEAFTDCYPARREIAEKMVADRKAAALKQAQYIEENKIWQSERKKTEAESSRNYRKSLEKKRTPEIKKEQSKMSEKAKGRKFIVAYDFSNPQKSVILSDEPTVPPREALTKIDTNSFVGQGVSICECRVVESLDNAKDRCCEIVAGGKPTILEITEIIERFPIIEGELQPGIYQFYATESNYYEIKDAAALSKFFNEEPNFDYANEKLVCRPDRICLYDIKTDEEVCFYERHPLTFFDVHCPLCRQKVMTYETEPDCFECEYVSSPCPHFVGNAVLCAFDYEPEDLDDLKINYTFIDDSLRFETAEGWQKPVIYAPPHQPLDSFWDGSRAESGYADHFFFMKSEPRFSVK